MGAPGAQAVAEALRGNTLQWLDLSNNGIGDAGAQAVGGALRGNTTLQYLDLRFAHYDYEIDNQARRICEEICEALQGITTLQTLALYGDIPDGAQMNLRTFL